MSANNLKNYDGGDLGLGRGLKPGGLSAEVNFSSDTCCTLHNTNSDPAQFSGIETETTDENLQQPEQSVQSKFRSDYEEVPLESLRIPNYSFKHEFDESEKIRHECGPKKSELAKSSPQHQQEIEQLQQDLELCRLKLSSKYQAIKILQQQLVIANKDKQLASGKSNQLQKRFIKEINQLQFELEREEGTLMKCQESWTSRFDRICQENFEHTLALKRQEDEICKLRGENKELANIFFNSPALNLERDELRALLNIKERNIYDASRINLIEDDSFQNFSVFQLSVLGSCKCSLANLGPCDCAKLAACLKKEISLLRQEVEQQKKQKEQALIVSDAYRVAFEEQLIKNRSFVLNCSKSCSDNSDMGPVNSLKIKMAKVLRCKSVSEDCLNTESKYVDSLHSEDIKDDCVRSCANLRQSVMLSLMEMVNDKTEALVHQRIVARMLASKTKHLEKKLLSYEDDPQDRSTNDDDITWTQSSGNS